MDLFLLNHLLVLLLVKISAVTEVNDLSLQPPVLLNAQMLSNCEVNLTKLGFT